MHHRSKTYTTRHPYPIRKTRNSVQLLIKKNSELEKRLANIEASLSQLESKAFETNARVGQAELRSGRFDMRAAGAEEKAARAEERTIAAEAAKERAAGAEERAARAEERAAGAEERAARAEERTIRLEEKWMKITRVIKMPFRLARLLVSSPRQLIRKIQKRIVPSFGDTQNSGEVQPNHDLTNTIPDNDTVSVSPSPRAQQLYQNLKTAIAEQKDREQCV